MLTFMAAVAAALVVAFAVRASRPVLPRGFGSRSTHADGFDDLVPLDVTSDGALDGDFEIEDPGSHIDGAA
jgi:hypothetical protein